MKNSSAFFRNYECDKFPCHETEKEDAFNCLFCFCPLYHFDDCGGNYSFTEKNIKDCSQCTLPHIAKNYDLIVSKLKSKE